MKNDDRDELDDMIDGALAGYSSADPMEGLEDRVLHRVHQAGAARRRPWPYRLGLALPTLAAMLVAAITFRMGWNPQSRATNTTRSVAVLRLPSPTTKPQLRPAPALRAAKPKRSGRTRQEHIVPASSLPKEEFFPSPVPITNEERALAAWVGRAPLEAQQAFAALRKQVDGPIAILPIQIPPLQSDGAQ